MVVLQALQWLVANNVYYHDVTTDHSVLAYLPIDGELTSLPTMSVLSSNEPIDTPPTDHQEKDPHNAHLPNTFLPMPVRGVTEQEAIINPLNKMSGLQPLGIQSMSSQLKGTCFVPFLLYS